MSHRGKIHVVLKFYSSSLFGGLYDFCAFVTSKNIHNISKKDSYRLVKQAAKIIIESCPIYFFVIKNHFLFTHLKYRDKWNSFEIFFLK
jgi:hypothetical protein